MDIASGSFFYILSKQFEHSSRSTGRILQVKFFLYFIRTKFEHSSRSTGLPAQRGTRTGQQQVHTIQELCTACNEFVTGNKK